MGMTCFQGVVTQVSPRQWGDDAIEGLMSLIAEAVRSSDHERAAMLDRALHDVAMLLQLVQEPRPDHRGGQSSNCSVREQQASFHAACDSKGRMAALHDPPAGPEWRDFQALTDREKQIIEQLTRGAANKVIARELNIAEAKVKAHIKTILRKLGLNNRTQAALCAIHQGWLPDKLSFEE